MVEYSESLLWSWVSKETMNTASEVIYSNNICAVTYAVPIWLYFQKYLLLFVNFRSDCSVFKLVWGSLRIILFELTVYIKSVSHDKMLIIECSFLLFKTLKSFIEKRTHHWKNKTRQTVQQTLWNHVLYLWTEKKCKDNKTVVSSFSGMSFDHNTGVNTMQWHSVRDVTLHSLAETRRDVW